MSEQLVIGYEGKRAVANRTGLGNYARRLLEALVETYPDNVYNVYVPSLPQDAPRVKGVNYRTPVGGLGAKLPGLWRQRGQGAQAARDGCMLFHGLANELPTDISSSKMASVVTVHDIIFRRHPDGYNAVDRAIYDTKCRLACRAATRIIAASECTKADIVRDYRVTPDKIDVIYQGCHPQFYLPDPGPEEAFQPVRLRYRLGDEYIISVGTVEKRKNQLLAVMGLRALPLHVKLVIVGRRTAYAKEIDDWAARHNLTGRIIWLENLPFAELPALYAHALWSTYTSRYEGFGIPVCESLAAGTPVVACKGSCLEEAGGEGAIYVGPDDFPGISEVFTRLYKRPDDRQHLVEAGREHIAPFTTEAMAEQTMDTYTDAVSMRESESLSRMKNE